MTDSPLESALLKLTDIQRQAVEWDQGPLLVLAGPGSGKTQVLTCRIARLLDRARDQNFRVLALTFTNKAADEMKGRVAGFVPGLEDRATIGTVHSFCGQILRQHGVHLGINPDFAIYSADDDRKAVLEDALQRARSEGKQASPDDVKYLALIDRLKSKLIEPAAAGAALASLDDAKRVVATYQLYEDELRRVNALDFNSLIFEAYRLVKTYPAIASRYRRSYPHWLIDEFQDTNSAQYQLVRTLAGDGFRSIFAVADDDQIIYGWNGASYKQIQSFLADFSAQLIQLPTNYRCPAAIVEAANRLVVYNAQRTSTKKPLIAGKTELKYPPSEHIQLRVFDTDEEEAAGIAQEIAGRDRSLWGQAAVLARTRALLDRMHKALQQREVPSVIAQRRDNFLSAEFRWLAASLRQIARPLDRRNVAVLVEAFNRLADSAVSVEQVITDAETTGRAYLVTWLETAGAQKGIRATETNLLTLLLPCATDPSGVKPAIEAILGEFGKKLVGPAADSDLGEDMAAWKELSRDIAGHIGKNAPLDQFLQELQLRSKEPSPKPDTVTLMTIHGAKGREFDYVYVVGLAEDVMPSFQSRQKGDLSPEMEEERRNCFVAITRTKECLVLSSAESYRGWRKTPSRFLVEMGLVNADEET
ncbi:MAG TPA: ATP-dependent helicase [Edaphobacter sp.]|uniref:ATP-dependent helicase n=1 Tax=Edaphobacter sp. TaxID=1934404 RepID=UPI002B94EDE3|nr:ATP-dependent helicase [Edaphobacter sp.]HUZ96643.1 ATP-dependent helicase [Edaphobacter sp.]